MTIIEKLTELVRTIHYWHYAAMDDGEAGKHPECTTYDPALFWSSEKPFRCCSCVATMDDVQSSMTFQCPQCASDRFGSTSSGSFVYYCRGYEGRGKCGFEWKPADSWRYFYQVTRTPFASAEEYNRRGS